MAIFDLDSDGDLDLFLFDATLTDAGLSLGAIVWEQTAPRTFAEPRRILDGSPVWGSHFEVVPADPTGDGLLYLYTCNDFGEEKGPNQVLVNQGDGTFQPGPSDGADVTMNCMGASLSDLNQDGRLDIYLTGIERPRLLLGSDQGFVESGLAWGLPAPTDPQMAWGSQLVDLDNDGLMDILTTTSDFSEIDAELFGVWALSQDSPGHLTQRGAELGLTQDGGARAILARDLNNDGLVDLAIQDFAAGPWLYLSRGCTADHWL